MVEPFDPHKIPVLMVHGLWSSPMTWMEMFNDLLAYPEIEGVNWMLGEPAPRVYYNTVNNTQGVEGYAAGWVQLADSSASRKIVTDVQKRLRREFPEAEMAIHLIFHMSLILLRGHRFHDQLQSHLALVAYPQRGRLQLRPPLRTIMWIRR